MLPIKPMVVSASTEIIVTSSVIYMAPLKFGEIEYSINNSHPLSLESRFKKCKFYELNDFLRFLPVFNQERERESWPASRFQ
jgi:hypothetical protein